MKHLIGILGFNSQERVNKCAASLAVDKPVDSAIWLVNNGVEPLTPPPACDYVIHIHEQTGGGIGSIRGRRRTFGPCRQVRRSPVAVTPARR